MSDTNFRKNMIRIFSKVVSNDVIARKFKENACHLCKVEFHDEKAAWKHYYGSLHGDKMKRLPMMEKAPEFWVMILKSLEAFDPKLLSKKELIDFMVDRFDVRENFSMHIINDKVDTNMAEMIDYFQTVKKTGNLYGLKQRGRQELQKVAGKRFLEHENRRHDDEGLNRDLRSGSDRKRSGDDQRNHDQVYKRRRQQDKEISSSRGYKRERRSSSQESRHNMQEEAKSSASEKSLSESRKTPSPSALHKHLQQQYLQAPQLQQYLQAYQQQNLQVPQQPASTRPIIILPPNMNLSSLPPNLLSSLGPALSQMMTPQQLQSHPMMFPFSQQVQQQQQFQTRVPSNGSPQPPSPTTTTTPTTSKPELSPASHYKKFVQQHQQVEEPQSARV